MPFAEETGPVDSSATNAINNHYLKMGFIPDSTTSSDTHSDTEPPTLYQPEDDSRFLNRSSAQPDFTPLKRSAPQIPDRPDMIDMSPHHHKKK